jgi:hypothetical protein
MEGAPELKTGTAGREQPHADTNSLKGDKVSSLGKKEAQIRIQTFLSAYKGKIEDILLKEGRELFR